MYCFYSTICDIIYLNKTDNTNYLRFFFCTNTLCKKYNVFIIFVILFIFVFSRDKNHVMQLMKRYPNMDMEALKQKYPSVDIEKIKNYSKVNGHYVP